MKVVMIGPDRNVHGGISGVVNLYYQAKLDQKITLKYIGTMKEGNKVKKLIVAVVAYLSFLLQLPTGEIVHVHLASDNSYRRKVLFMKTAALFHKRIILHQHGGDIIHFYQEELSEAGKKRFRENFSLAEKVLVIAPYLQDFFAGIVDPKKVFLFADTIVVPPYKEKNFGKHELLFLGRICKEKGIYELLESVSQLQNLTPKPFLYLGGVIEDEDLLAQIEKHQDCVKWLGWITGEEKAKYLEQCDLFVLPSYFEGQSVAILEAMAAGCGIVASNVGGIPQMIIPDETGVLVSPKNVEALTEGIKRLLQSEDTLQMVSRNARRKVECEFSIEGTLDRLMAIYEGTL